MQSATDVDDLAEAHAAYLNAALAAARCPGGLPADKAEATLQAALTLFNLVHNARLIMFALA